MFMKYRDCQRIVGVSEVGVGGKLCSVMKFTVLSCWWNGLGLRYAWRRGMESE